MKILLVYLEGLEQFGVLTDEHEAVMSLHIEAVERQLQQSTDNQYDANDLREALRLAGIETIEIANDSYGMML